MSSKLKRQKAVPAPVRPEAGRPGFFRRIAAYMLDWFIGDLFASFPVTILYAMIYDTTELNNELASFSLGIGVLAGILALLLSVVYYLIFPLKIWSGQTIGKRICGLKIVMLDGGRARIKALAVRQILGILLIEGCLMTASHYLRQLVYIITKADWVLKYPYYAGIGFAGISVALIVFSRNRRGLHDYLAGTKLVLAQAE